jgi:hypothetical protein
VVERAPGTLHERGSSPELVSGRERGPEDHIAIAEAAKAAASEVALYLDDAALVGHDHELHAVAGAEFHQDSGDVGLGGERAEVE